MIRPIACAAIVVVFVPSFASVVTIEALGGAILHRSALGEMTMTAFRVFLATALLSSGLAGHAIAQDRYAEQAQAYLANFASTLADRGWDFEQAIDGSLRNGYRSTRWIHLEAGTEYFISGRCDDDCPDLDLKLYSAGSLVAADTDDDDRPLLSFEPSRSGEYRLDVIMARCNDGPCRFAVGVFTR